MLNNKGISKGLELNIFQKLKTVKLKKDYYLYTGYTLCNEEQKMTFYSKVNNQSNTWNIQLKYDYLNKDKIMEISPKFGFGNYQINSDTSRLVVKDNRNYQKKGYVNAFLTDINTFNKKFRANVNLVGQSLLINSNREELNVFCVRNLETRKFEYLFVNIVNNNINNQFNRKLSKSIKTYKIDNPSEQLPSYDKLINNLEDYLNFLNLDFARVEVINDDFRGWCVIDINDSPGQGILTSTYINDIVKLFLLVCR